ncbi:hypothetical protein L207DRAFT_582699 [Hyaloscypha variabilis F]|uniref:Uncharacterized protein n=1 Tax=Hyaloscypha variabilis (strain UAMH 11265 / GT02V1 / F) TaxID=1149755 RepID=A0A2J6RPR6_HYAVF|nr:hypothetical protein L207DRAFT_582699 [Hyaloscypha variabilis F]
MFCAWQYLRPTEIDMSDHFEFLANNAEHRAEPRHSCTKYNDSFPERLKTCRRGGSRLFAPPSPWDEAGAKSPGIAPPPRLPPKGHASISKSPDLKPFADGLCRTCTSTVPHQTAKQPVPTGPVTEQREHMTTSCSSLPRETQQCHSSKSHLQKVGSSTASTNPVLSRFEKDFGAISATMSTNVNQGPNARNQPLS